MTRACDLAIIVVSWNVWDLLRASLESIGRDSVPTADPHLRRFGPEGDATLQVIVVDNASTDATPSLLRARFPWVRSVLSEENLGFTGANNLGLTLLGFDLQGNGGARQAADRSRQNNPATGQTPHAVYFLNPDTELLPNSLWTLYRGIAADDGVGALGPQLRYADGSHQDSRRRFPTPLTGFFESTWLGRLWPGNPWLRRYHMADWAPGVRQDVDWLVGAALLVRGAALAAVGGFDERFFMYSEELDLCKRLKAAGWRVVYEPGAIVVHYEGRSSEQTATRRHILFNRSKVLYYRKHVSPIWAEFLRRYLLFEYRWQMGLEQAKAFLGHKRELRRIRVESYRRVVHSGLNGAPLQE